MKSDLQIIEKNIQLNRVEIKGKLDTFEIAIKKV